MTILHHRKHVQAVTLREKVKAKVALRVSISIDLELCPSNKLQTARAHGEEDVWFISSTMKIIQWF